VSESAGARSFWCFHEVADSSFVKINQRARGGPRKRKKRGKKEVVCKSVKVKRRAKGKAKEGEGTNFSIRDRSQKESFTYQTERESRGIRERESRNAIQVG